MPPISDASQPSAPGSTSSGWLRALQSREASAWQRLTQLYGPLVYAWCRRQGLPAGDAADVLQEVFKAVVVSVAEFTPRGPGTFRGWLRTIARNKVFDHFRRQKGHPEAELDSAMQQQLAAVPEPDSAVSDASERALLLQAILTRIRPEFNEKSWQAFWRLAVEGHSSSEIATDLGMTPEAVRQSKARILRRLRNELDET
jgi:RNA polymerase sigma-70 factor, ECF subfamily